MDSQIAKSNPYCNFTYSLLGIETLYFASLIIIPVVLQFHLLPIRDWNVHLDLPPSHHQPLQFHLLPIRDWNSALEKLNSLKQIAISLTPY